MKLKEFKAAPSLPILNATILERVFDDSDNFVGFIMQDSEGNVFSRRHGVDTDLLKSRLDFWKSNFIKSLK